MKYLNLLLVITLFSSCSHPKFRSRWTKEEAPAVFITRFESAKGSFDVELHREYSPKAVDRVYQLVKHHYYDNGLFYRVVPKFVVQFGNTDTVVQAKFQKTIIPDESVIYPNKRGTISFARSGKDSRATELFINLKDNPKLDTIHYGGVTGFPAFGNVIRGMDVVDSLYGGYADNTMKKYELMYRDTAKFKAIFPKIDGIIKAVIVKKD